MERLREENKELWAQMSTGASLKVGTLKVGKQPYDKLLRHLSLGAQSSHPTATRDDIRRNLR